MVALIAKDQGLYHYNAHVDRVIDGDTAEMTIDLGFKIYLERSCRLAGINAPELNSTDSDTRLKAQQSRDELKSLIEGKEVLIISRTLDKYGRPLVTIYNNAGVDINQYMLDNDFAVVYGG